MLNYTPETLGVQSWREIISGGTRTKEKLYLGVREQKRLNSTGVGHKKAQLQYLSKRARLTETAVGRCWLYQAFRIGEQYTTILHPYTPSSVGSRLRRRQSVT
jgi:hypothetical protein